MLIVTTESRDIYRNLAIEEGLLDSAASLPVLFVYVNDPCVVIGKNQNPWRECRLSTMQDDGISLARRISGGGAVYHDEGNLNVSIIVPRTEYVEQKQYDLIIQSLTLFGIHAAALGKNSLGINGLKFSGQAFCHRRDRTLHHGTLLVNSDLDRLDRYLGAEIQGIETKAIASVPAAVTNLTAFSPELTTEKLAEQLAETFQEMYDKNGMLECWNLSRHRRDDGLVSEEAISSLCERNQSTEWLYERTPPFEVEMDGRRAEVKKGRVVSLPGSPLFEEL